MDLSLQVTRFLHRLRYKLILPCIFVAFVVAYFTQFLAKEYTVVASVFTGIASNKGLDADQRHDYITLANTFDNVINFTRSKVSLEKVCMKLLAQNLMYGDVFKDNEYITAKNYIKLVEMTPKEVMDIIDKDSLETTLKNFNKYKQSVQDNFIYELFNSIDPHYSYVALNRIQIRRMNASDLIELSYSSDDPGISYKTVELITDELMKSDHTFKYKSSDEVVVYYEEQLKQHKAALDVKEDLLMQYNEKYKVINYADQTKELSATMANFEERYERVLVEYASSKDLVEILGKYMTAKSEMHSTNGEFLLALSQISTINDKITESEMFNNKVTLTGFNNVTEQRQQLAAAEEYAEGVADKMKAIKYSKEGVALDEIVNQWLGASINNVKSKAELKVLEERKKHYEAQQIYYSPIGTQLSRMEREISVTERSYLDALNNLGVANQRKNSIKLESSSPEIVTPAEYPLRSNEQKRYIYVLAAFLATFILIVGCEIVIELIDRTLRDPIRAQELTSLETIGALLGSKQFKYRGYTRESNRISARSICNKLNHLLGNNKTIYINIFSIENSEGKSYVLQYMRKVWEGQGLKIEILNHGDDYLCDINYLRAKSLSFFKHEPADVVFIEYPPLSEQSIPPVFLRDANANIMVANARRGWRTSDDEYIKYLSKDVDNEVVLILNNTDREFVEYLVGELLRHEKNRTLSSRMKQLTFTSEGNGIK